MKQVKFIKKKKLISFTSKIFVKNLDKKILFSSVVPSSFKIFKSYFKKNGYKLFEIKDLKINKIIKLKVDNYRQVGSDRIANAIGSYYIHKKNCLDIGPGSGRWINYLKKKKSKNIFAVDLSEKVIDLNKKNCKEIFKLDLEKKSIPLKNSSIDLIICFEVLEHLRQPDFFLKEVVRLLKKDSIAVFSMPNILYVDA